uniref:Uncharacterized protein n=1 Tax=Arundo donax TaxID=35708 RepID=A0A0A9GTI9_ARUDO
METAASTPPNWSRSRRKRCSLWCLGRSKMLTTLLIHGTFFNYSCADTVNGDADKLCVVVVLKFPVQLQSLSLDIKFSTAIRLTLLSAKMKTPLWLVLRLHFLPRQ